MRIKSLDPDVVKKLRSDIAFSSVAQCVEELVWNSIDSGASCIAVRLNLHFYKIQVIDNGCGIPSDQMALVGNRYSTSKCHTLEDLQNLQYGGFRGEALASLKEVASNLMIESRASGSLETCCKIFTHGKASEPSPSINSRPSKGTTVTVFDFMYNRPVRKQNISEAIDPEETRRLLQSVALVHPHISFSLQSESTGEMCLQFRKCSSVFFAFMELFGKDKGKNLKSVESEFEGYSISGCIGTDPFSCKDYQFLYVNKRLIRKTSLHKLINGLLNKAFSKKQLDTSPQIASPSKNQLQYCAFVLDIACGRNKYDAVFDHKTTMVEFTEWDKVSKLVEVSVLNFLRSEHLISSSAALDEQTIPNPTDFEACNGQFLNLGIDYFKNGLFSHAVKRREDAKEETRSNLSPAENTNAKINRDCDLPIATKNLISNSCCEPSSLFTELSNDKSITMDKIPHYQNVNEVSNENPIDKSYICLKNMSNTSVLDTLKVHTKYVAKNNNKVSLSNAKVSTPSSVETHVDIPCRSVFPIQSPVMLRVPTKSTLSQLQKKRGDTSMMLKIKEKYVFSSKKTKKFSEKSKEITRKVVDKPDGFKNNDQINYNQYELPSLVNKHCKNAVEIKTVYKTCDKKSPILKSSSMVNKKTCRITSKYKFLDDTQSAPLKRLQHKNKQKKLTTFLEDKSDLNSFSIEFEHSKTFSLSPLIEASTSIPSSPDIFRTFEKQGNLNDDQSSLRQNDIFKSISPINTTSQALTKDNPKLRKHKNCHSSHSANIGNSTSSFSETKTSNFFLTSFKHNKRKSNGDISPKEKRSIENFSLPNLNQTKSTDLHNENIKSKCNDPNKSGDFLLKKFQTSTELVTPHSLLNAKKLKTISTFTDSSESVVIEKQQSNQNASAIIKTNIKDDTNLLIGNNEQNSSLAYRLFHNLDKDICLPDITESQHISEFYNSGKSKVIDISENVSNTLFQDQTNITESSCELSPTAPFETNHYSTTCNNFFINQPGILNDGNGAEKHYLSTTSPDRDFVFNSENILLENMLLENFSTSSVSSNIVVKRFHEDRTVAIQISPKEKCSVLPDNEMETLDSDNSASVTKTPFCRNINKYDSSSEFHEASLHENSKETGLSCIQINGKADCPNGFNNELPKRCDNDSDPHCLSNEPLNPALCEISDKTSIGNSECRTAIENCDAVSSEVESSKINNDGNETKGSRWIRQVNEETKRIAYIDSVTGNSTYILPEVLKYNEASSSKEELPETLRKKSHFFLTHDFSPFVRSTYSPKESNGIDDTCDLQNDLHSYIDQEEANDWHRKWRYPLEKADSCDNTIQGMFSKWENPMFDIAPEMNNIEEPKVPVCLPHMYFLNSYRFNSSSLNGLKVIGQVDCKFIASIIQDFSDNYKNRRLLTLFDQHAVHERIKLEELTDDLYDTKEDGRRIVKFKPISPPLKFKLEPSEVRLLCNYHASLQELGISISVKEDTNEIEVNSLPVCLVKDGNQLRRKADEMNVLVEKIIKEWLSSLMRNRGVSSLLPRTLSAVLNSQACRGAVKFGDPLDPSQCKNLLTSLSHCKLPFQCAHGRPSIAPILDLNKLAKITKKRQPPQLWKLSQHIQKQSMV